MKTIKSNETVVAQEMAMPLPSAIALKIYDSAVTDPDNFPTPEQLMKIHDAVNGYYPQDRALYSFVSRDYPKLYNKIIFPLQKYMWPLRNNPAELEVWVKDNPFYYGGANRNPEESTDPIRQSLQNLKDWIYYYTNDLYALMRPELLRQVNELKSVLLRPIKAQRRTTPRSEVPTEGPAIKTPEVTISSESLEDETVWKVQTVVYTRGGLSKHTFADFFDTEWQARRSPLMVEAKNLTPEKYLTTFREYELIED